jgi:hypothetical protein
MFIDRMVGAGAESGALFPDPITVNRALRFYCAGFIEYHDIFREKSHISRFLFQIDPLIPHVERAGLPAWERLGLAKASRPKARRRRPVGASTRDPITCPLLKSLIVAAASL